MHSVIETIENESPTAVAVQNLWLKSNRLYWPPGKNVDRRTPSFPQANWLEFDYKLLKTSIETFEEAVELEKMYSKHRDSNSFREYQEQQKLKRLHPVNCADRSNSDLIDVNQMIENINANAGTNEQTFVDAGQRKYHESCMTSKSGTLPKKLVAKDARASVKLKTGTQKGSVGAVKKCVKKPLPFQRNYLRPGISKAKNLVPRVTKPKVSRYDNFLKSGSRFDGLTDKVKAKNAVPSATITKDQYLKQIAATNGIDSDYGNSAQSIFGRTSTPIESTQDGNLHENYNSANNGEDSNQMNFDENVNDLENIRPATMTSSQTDMSFEERVLTELSGIKKNQESFEARIEKRIENFFNDQSRLQGISQSRLQGNSQSRLQGNSQSRLQGNSQSRLQGNSQSSLQGNSHSHMQRNYQSGTQYQSRQHGGRRNEMQSRHRQTVSPERYVDDFEDFEELDRHFPIRKESRVEELEFNIRKDLDFKFLLNSRLDELGAKHFKKCIRLKMKYLFSDQVLDLYTWNGTEEKTSFQKLKAVNNLILRSVRDRCPNTERDEYKDYMVQWLKHSRSRQRKVTYVYPDRNNRDDTSDEDDENIN